ncbi:MAG: hemolysin A [uncultured bacterium (gcode 4)]|uniref:Hemolysin A n=1 Tax=uncultured bacterium (gcode 4) TaxID=1234023 RepID=K2F5W3_9BACT|nr:MAG: hemolysin A [uncultured bacterium (gcode 4)]
MRLDRFISEKYDFSRNKAQFLVKEWLVKVNSKIIEKVSFDTKETDFIEIIEDRRNEFVARSAVKLYDFLDLIDLDVTDFICLDIWASTWWFSQVMLLRWAKLIYAIDVWTSQLHESIKNNSKIISFENTDIRKYESKEKFDLITVDVSFISLTKIISKIKELSSKNTNVILLFKPQFEVWKANIWKNWVVKDKKAITNSLDSFKKILKENGFQIQKLSESTLPGEAWNIEYLIFLKVI